MRDDAVRDDEVRPDGSGDEGPDGWDEDDWEAQQERARRQRLRRVRRQRVVFLVVVLLVLAVGAGAALVVTGRWDPWAQEAAAPSASCTPGAAPAVAAPAEVRLQVLNSTDRRGLAGATADELRRRGFTVTLVGNSDGDALPGVAEVRHAPAAAPAALAVAARLPGAGLVEDPAAVDVVLVLGQGYQQLAAEDALALPPAPPGCPPAPTPAA